MKKKKRSPSQFPLTLYTAAGIIVILLLGLTFFLIRRTISPHFHVATEERPVELLYHLNTWNEPSEDTIFAVNVGTGENRQLVEIDTPEQSRQEFTHAAQQQVFAYIARPMRESAFGSRPTMTPEIITYSLQSGIVQQLTESSNSLAAPVFSPSGEWIAYRDDWERVIFITSLDGTQHYEPPRQVNRRNEDAFWSPDGQHLAVAYREKEGNTPGLAIYDVTYTDTGLQISEPTTIAQGGSMLWQVAWSPDSSQIAYVHAMTNDNSPDEVWIRPLVAPETGQFFMTLTETAHGLIWSPDSEWLIYEGVNHTRGPYGDLHLIDTDTGTIENLTQSGADDDVKVWLPTGEIIHQRNRDLMAMDFETRTVRQLVKDPPDTGGYQYIEFIGWRYVEED